MVCNIPTNGYPTFFVSLSCADTHWPGLIYSLGKIVDKKENSLKECKSMSYMEKYRLFNADLTTMCRFFDSHFKKFI